jgi:hypothetical protein
MVSAVLVCTSLIASFPTEGPSSPDVAAYEAARAQAGRDPEAHVRLALWCEAHGLKAERMKHLAIAVLSDPKNAMARGLMGLVAHRGHWQRPEAVADQIKADAKLAAAIEQYKDRRVKAPATADGQWKLALWCEEIGLKAEAIAHLSAVVRLDPSREAAWKRLGYKKQGGRWVTEAQIADEKAEADRQKQADRHWKPLLEKWRGWLDDKGKRTRAETALTDVTDPRAVPMVWAVFAAGPSDRQAVAVRVFGQIDSAGASRALATLAVFGKSDDVRRAATETLRRRDAREYADILIALLRDPIKYEVKPVAGPGSQGVLDVKGSKANVKRLYSPPSAPIVAVWPNDQVQYDANGLPVVMHPLGYFNTGPIFSSFAFSSSSNRPLNAAQQQHLVNTLEKNGAGDRAGQVAQALMSASQNYQWMMDPNAWGVSQMLSSSLMMIPPNPTTRFDIRYGRQVAIPIGEMQAEARLAAAVAQQQLQGDVKAIDDYNAPIKELNGRIIPILKEAAGQDLGEDREAWRKWSVDLIGFADMPQKYSEIPTVIEQVPLAYQPQTLPVAIDTPVGFRRMSCFGAGTPVRTIAGLRPIESLREGDQVLTQDIKTGALNYRPILVVHRNPPSATYTIDLEGEAIVSSHFHRFWKAGRGWVMARDLKPGDVVRTLGGLVKVASIEADRVQPVFNLDVAEDADFFVGDRGALVHDNTLPDLRLAPFDAPPSLASSGSTSAPR